MGRKKRKHENQETPGAPAAPELDRAPDGPEAADPESDGPPDVDPTAAERRAERVKAIVQEAIFLFKRQRSSIVDLDKATKAYLDEFGETP